MFNLRRSPDPSPEETVWLVKVDPPVQGNPSWKLRLLEGLRADLSRALEREPNRREFTWGSYLKVTVALESGRWQPGSPVRLRWQEPPSPPTPKEMEAVPLPSFDLPNEAFTRLESRLVGLESILSDISVRLHCRWNGRLQRWSEDTGLTLPSRLVDLLEETPPFFILEGIPGVGKSAGAKVAANRYCRETGVTGRLFLINTNVRDSLVGATGKHLRQTLRTIRSTSDGPAFVLLDEADALAMKRSEERAHHEDRATTATLLQELDSLGSHQTAIFLTTNLLSSIDSAVRRRGITYTIQQPGKSDRRRLLDPWFSGHPTALAAAVAVSRGLTPADIERGLVGAYLRAVAGQRPVRSRELLDSLRTAERTGRV